MKIRVYRTEWFYNMGIVGLYKILKKAGQPVEILDDSIEFDREALNNFADYYFDYFIDDYLSNVHSTRIESIRKVSDVNDKRLKRIVDSLLKKYGKVYGDEEAKKLKEELGNKRKDFESYKETLLEILERDEVKERFSIDYIRSIMYDNFFGQMGFLNKPLANAGLEKFKEVLHEQFIAPLMEDIALEAWINGESEKPKFLENNAHELSKKFERYKKKVKNLGSEVGTFKTFLEDNFHKCSLCGSHYCTSPKDVFDEVRFVPLAVSQETPNFFWNFDFHLPLCKVCKLILLCTPAGATYYNALRTIYYDQMDPEQRREGTFLFVNVESSLQDLIDINVHTEYRFSKSVFEDVILNVVERYAKLSEWTLENTFFVEFNAKYESKQAKVRYFHIHKSTADFLRSYHRSTLAHIRDFDLRELFLSRIVFNGNLDEVIYKALSRVAAGELHYEDALSMIKAKALLNAIKKGGISVNKVQRFIEDAKNAGKDIRRKLKEEKQENKLQTISYKLLNTSRIGDKKSFVDTLLRLYMSLEMEVPKFVFELLTESTTDFETLAQSFIAGLLSSDHEKFGKEVYSETTENNYDE